MRATLRKHKPKAVEALDRIEPRETEATELRNNSEVPKACWDVKDHPKIINILSILKDRYPEDHFFGDIWKNPDRHS